MEKVNAVRVGDSSLVATDNLTARCGSVFWWDMSGHIDIDAFQKKLEANYLSKTFGVKPPTCKTALNRAVEESRPGRTVKHRLAKDGSWVITAIREDKNKDDPEYAVTIKVKLNAMNGVSCQYDSNNAEAVAMAAQIKKQYAYFLDVFTPTDIVGWFVDKVVAGCNGIAMRRHGGCYFIPSPYDATELKLAVDVVKSLSDSQFYILPVMRQEDAIDAVMRSLSEEAKQFEKEMQEAASDVTKGERALVARQHQCEAFIHKLKKYEELLNTSTSNISEKIVDVKAALATAAFAAEARAEEAKENE